MTKAGNSQIMRTISLLITIFSLSFPAYAKYGGGTGEPNDPYLIYTAEQLNTIGLNQEDADKHFKLMADIDLSGYQGDSFNRIGFYDPPELAPGWHPPFEGVFDGNNHTISNFTYVIDVNEPLEENGRWGDEYVGLFGRIVGTESQIKNLVLIDPNIYPAATCSERVRAVGAIAGRLSDGSITNCYVIGGRISADVTVGGLVGSNLEGTISDCHTTCNVNWAKDRWLRPLDKPFGSIGFSFGGLVGYSRGWIYNCHATGSIQGAGSTGGLVGYNDSDPFNPESEVGIISESYANGDVSGNKNIGGLVGENSGKIHRCHALGNVSGSNQVGGLVGDMVIDEGSISDSYATGDVSGNEQVGGLVGYSNGLTQDSCATGEVSGTVYVGGLIGFNGSGTIYRSYASGAVSGSENVGALVGRNGKGMIDCCYARGEVLGTIYVGGLVGTNFSTIRCSYAANAVSGIQKVGGLVGDNWSNGATIITCLWDIETSGLTDMCGIQSSSAIGCNNTYGKTTIEMQTANTFLDVGWDFMDETTNGTEDIWKITEGLSYPHLWWEKYGGGTGDPNAPYLIYTAEQLNTIGLNKEDADKHFKLMADIDLSAYQGDSFNRIGFYDPPEFAPDWHPPFEGVFDGNNHTISNFTYVVDVNEPLKENGLWGDEDVGLFGVVRGAQAQIKNLGLINPEIHPAVTCTERVASVGAIVGSLRDSSITNCYVEGGRISGDNSVGGLVGSNTEGTISNCYTTCNVNWTKGRWLRSLDLPFEMNAGSFGGLAGSSRGWIYNCHATGSIQGVWSTGGLVGFNDCEPLNPELEIGVISNSYATGDVSGDDDVGGLAGSNRGKIHRCLAVGNVSGTDKVGGLVGNMIMDEGSISYSYSIANVSGNEQVGGLVGYSNGSIQQSYAVSEVLGTVYVGGLVGWNGFGTIHNSYTWGSVTGSENVGALSGRNGSGSIYCCYATNTVNTVSESENVGGFLGGNVAGIVSACVWNIETSGLLDMCGFQVGVAEGCDNEYGKTTIEMQTASTFLDVGWDFVDETANGTEDIWWILEGQDYPRLWWEALE